MQNLKHVSARQILPAGNDKWQSLSGEETMKPARSRVCLPGSGTQAPAFTLTELLVVLAILAVLVCLQLPALARARALTKVEQCSGNLRQYALVALIYATENNNNLPATQGGFWPWDLPAAPRQALLRYGATRGTFYCPGNPDQNIDAAWNYAGGAFSVTGYEMANSGSVVATNWNVSILPPSIPSGTPAGVYPPPLASQRVLLADATISLNGQSNPALRNTYQYTGIVGGLVINGRAFPHRTSHLNGTVPSGGNLGMLDGHVEWRSFSAMVPRTSGSSTPTFWW
jgi:prepilin-type N-terminal cleavage/methylation domain-containing protein/prepilin-type processing-associated H-X9-DG protein